MLSAGVKLAAALTYAKNEDNYPYSDEIKDKFKKILKSQRKKALPKEIDNSQYISFMTRERPIPVEEIDELIETTSNVEVRAILLDCKIKYIF